MARKSVKPFIDCRTCRCHDFPASYEMIDCAGKRANLSSRTQRQRSEAVDGNADLFEPVGQYERPGCPSAARWRLDAIFESAQRRSKSSQRRSTSDALAR
jgi:hypothetical protein